MAALPDGYATSVEDSAVTGSPALQQVEFLCCFDCCYHFGSSISFAFLFSNFLFCCHLPTLPSSQRIALARALLREPPVLMLADSLSHLTCVAHSPSLFTVTSSRRLCE